MTLSPIQLDQLTRSSRGESVAGSRTSAEDFETLKGVVTNTEEKAALLAISSQHLLRPRRVGKDTATDAAEKASLSAAASKHVLSPARLVKGVVGEDEKPTLRAIASKHSLHQAKTSQPKI